MTLAQFAEPKQQVQSLCLCGCFTSVSCFAERLGIRQKLNMKRGRKSRNIRIALWKAGAEMTFALPS